MSKILPPRIKPPATKNITETNTHLKDLLSDKTPTFSVELCPVRNLDAVKLETAKFDFCSIIWMYTEKRPIPALVLAEELISRGQQVLLHLAGRNLKEKQLLEILQETKRIGVRNLLCLQGDPSQIKEENDNKCDFPRAKDLIDFIRRVCGDYYCIGAAAYPERKNGDNQDLQYLKAKIDAGADFILTQMTFDEDAFCDFRAKYEKMGFTTPIIAGVYVIHCYDELTKMAKFCGVEISDKIRNFFAASDEINNRDAAKHFGLATAAAFVERFRNSVAGFHVFSLNNVSLAVELRKFNKS